jgi:hypothetical protein
MSLRGCAVAWVSKHQRAAGVGLLVSAVALLGIAVVVGSAMVTRLPPQTAELGASSAPEHSPLAEPESAPTPTPTSTPTPSLSPTPVPAAGWTPVEIVGIGSLYGIAEHDGRLVAAGSSADGSVGSLATSDDGVTWTPVDLSVLEPGYTFYSVVAGESGFIALATRYPVPMGMPEHAFLYSDDGRTWHEAVAPAECFAGSIEKYEEGYIGLGGECRTEGDFRPSALHVITSPDGRSWTSQIHDQELAGAWATDGHRLVLFQHDPTGQAPPEIWISDDAGRNWRVVPDAFPAGVSVSGPLYGHDRYIAPGSWLIREGDPDSAVCVSVDGENWDCLVIPPLTGELAGRHWLARAIAVTPTGYASLVEYFKNTLPPYDPRIDMVAATSRDGLHWTFVAVPELANRLPTNLVWTSHGVFAWGGTNPNLRPGDVSMPYIDVYRLPLP